MKRLICGVCLALAMPAFAQESGFDTQFNDLNIEWEPFGVEVEQSDEAVVDKPVAAITLINRGDARALCQFVGASDQAGPAPVLVLEPNDRAVLRTPQSSDAESTALLQCVHG